MATSLFGTGPAINVNVNGTLVPQSFTATAGQTLFNLSGWSYTPGTNSLLVFINGQRQVITRDFTETSTTSFSLVEGCVAGDFVDVIGFPQLSLSAVPSGSITVQQNGSGAVTRSLSDKLSNYVNVKDFGAKGDGVTDDYAAIMAAINSVTYGTGYYISGPAVYFPPGVYYCSQTIQLKRSVRLFGDGSGMQTTSTASIRWPASTTGIIVHNYKTINSTVEGTPTTAGDGSIIEGLILTGGGGANTAHGIWLRARAEISKCYIIGFGGNGIQVIASSGGGGSIEGNANCFHLRDNVTILNGLHGLYVKGSDANAGYCIGLDSSYNNGCGVFDASFLGNTYVGCHSAVNGYRGAGVTYSGNQYMCIDSTLASTTYPGTNNAVWYFMQAGTISAQYPDFSYGAPYLDGCSYKSDNANARNILFGCYSESGQGPANLRSPAQIIGGLHGAGVAGSSPFMDSGLGFFKLDNAPVAPVQGISFASSIVQRSVDPNILDAYLESSSFVPAATNLTVVGTPSYVCNYTRVGNLVTFNIVITVSGGTTASTANSTYLTLPITPSNHSVCNVVDGNVNSLGAGFIDTTGRVYLPTWSARSTAIYISGSYNIGTSVV